MTQTDVSRPGAVPERLLRSSAKQSYDPEVDVDWAAPPVPGLWSMQPERMSLFGTPTWDRLSEEQRLELSKHEVASISSVGIWFEVLLMQMVLRDLYGADHTASRTHYALTEVGDETRHSIMFGKAIAATGVPAYGPPEQILRLGRLFPLVSRGVSAYASILVAEEILDRWQRELVTDERVQPLTRMVSRIHVLEEARHMTFARDEVERMVPRLSRVELVWHQEMVARISLCVARALVNPEVYRSVGLDPRAARREALGNPHYQETLAWMGEKVTAFLAEQGLMPAFTRRTWKRSMLVR